MKLKLLSLILMFSVTAAIAKTEVVDTSTTRELFKSYMKDKTTLENFVVELMSNVEALPANIAGIHDEASKLDPSAKVLEKVVELQGALDESIYEYNRTALAEQKRLRSAGHWKGLITGLLISTALQVFIGRKLSDFGPIVFGVAVFSTVPAASWGIGSAIGGSKAKAIPIAQYGHLLDYKSEVDEERLSEYSPVELIHMYMKGKATAVEVATSLIRSGDGFQSQWGSVRNAALRDYSMKAGSPERTKMRVLEHILRMKIAENNRKIFAKLDKARTWGAIGGAALCGLSTFGYRIHRKAHYRYGRNPWDKFRKILPYLRMSDFIFVAAAAVSGGSLGYFLTPGIVDMLGEDPINMESAFD